MQSRMRGFDDGMRWVCVWSYSWCLVIVAISGWMRMLREVIVLYMNSSSKQEEV
jgi:hypothetical protein